MQIRDGREAEKLNTLSRYFYSCKFELEELPMLLTGKLILNEGLNSNNWRLDPGWRGLE